MTVFHATHPNELQLLHHGQTLTCISGFFLYDENYQCKIAPSCYYPCQWGCRRMFCIVLYPNRWCILPASVWKRTTNWVSYHNQIICQSVYKKRPVFLVSHCSLITSLTEIAVNLHGWVDQYISRLFLQCYNQNNTRNALNFQSSYSNKLNKGDFHDKGIEELLLGNFSLYNSKPVQSRFIGFIPSPNVL